MPDESLKISISGKSLIELIKQLDASKVCEFRYKDLHIVLKAPEIKPYNFPSVEEHKPVPGNTRSLPGENLKSVDQLEEERLEELLITDPLAYEEAQNERISRFEEQAENN